MKREKVTCKSTHDRLVAEGFLPEQPLKVHSKISTNEKGKRYILVADGLESVVYAVDGNIIKDGLRCDKLVLVKCPANENELEKWAEVFVELKGVDTNHAIDQLRETLKKDMFKHPSNTIIRARIVAQSFPSNKSNPAMEKAKQEFRKNYNCELRGMKNGQEDTI